MDKIWKKKKLIAGLLGVIILATIGFSIFKKNKASAPQYTTALAEKGTLVVSLSASGSVSSNNSRTVTTTASGVVKKVYVKEGQKVYVGTPLLQIDLDLNGLQKYQSALASFQSAQNSLKSAQDKFYSLQSDLTSAKNIFINQWSMQSPDDPTYIQKHNAYLTAQAAFDNLQNQIKQSRTSLESSRLSYQAAGPVVYAPITGTIGSISLTPGMILNPTSDAANSSNSENKIAIVKTGATPSITVSLTEIDVPKVSVGDKVTITVDALPGKTFTGKVIAIDTTGTVSSGVVNYPVTIQLDSGVEGLLPNMSVTANILTDFKDNVVMVPNAAVQIATDGSTTIRLLKNGVLTSVSIVTGISNDTTTEISSGVSEGDEVVTAVTIGTAKTTTTTRSVFGGGGIGGFGR
jgi:multidrug efflux pump subunit AcrA (membrane-fusion protein)